MTSKNRFIKSVKGTVMLLLTGVLSVSMVLAQQAGGITLNPAVATLTGSQLVTDQAADLVYTPASEATRYIRNIVTFSIKEAAASYIPENFTASITVKVQYGNAAFTENELDQTFEVTYTKEEGAKYNAKKYLNFEGARYVRVKIVSVSPSVATLSNGVNVKDLLLLENEMRVTRYYSLATSNNIPAFGGISTTADELTVSWDLAEAAGYNQYQLEWTWLENELAYNYDNPNSTLNTDLLFRNNATRIDLPYNKTIYSIPLLYDGIGKLYYRVRAVNMNSTGSRADGPWTAVQSYAFNGHSDSLNWQVRTSFAEEGKRKTVVQYYDGSLRSRQTVTKDNVSNTTVTAETFYDGQGRAAIQILPVPSINTIIGYTKNLNLFNQQASGDDPAKYFDLVAISAPNTPPPALDTISGAARYYSAANDEKEEGANKNIPDAEGYPYALTRYTPDASGRILSQSGVGVTMRMGGGHETKYYYGTPAQEELDGLFGTEVGYNVHYSKNMVQDANGQMSVSYVDMHGRTIATALAGEPPANLSPILSETHYPGQSGTPMTRDLLDQGSNIAKGNVIESFNTILVPVRTTYQFRYKLDPASLQLPQCNSATSLSYDCMYDLEFSITDESGDTPPIVKKFSNIDPNADDLAATPAKLFKEEGTGAESNIITFSQVLEPGSYAIRKSLTLSEASLERYKAQYLVKGFCKTEQELIDSVQTVLKSESGCEGTPVQLTCAACLAGATTADEIANCMKLCTNVSHKLEMIRSMMISDMVPNTGQYAKEVAVPGSVMWNTYDIFSTAYTGQPYYKKPVDSDGVAGYYYDAYHNPDVSVHQNPVLPYQQLDTASQATFTGWFTYTWAESLLPHHPEYTKLRYAEANLKTAYDWMDNFSQVNTYAEALAGNYLVTGSSFGATPTDPFFATASGMKSAMQGIVAGSGYYQDLNLWEIAYGEGACKTIPDSAQRADCYAIGHAGPPYTGLTTEQSDRIWNVFKGLYQGVRDSMLIAYLDQSVTMTDEDDLVDQHYQLHFASNNQQAAQNPGWSSWYPSTPGAAPDVNMADSVKAVYDGRCSGYIEQWKQQLQQCPAIANMDSTVRKNLLNTITTRMEAVCRKGTDETNPYGASTVPPSTPQDGSPRSFEEVIEKVLDSLSISRNGLCNSFVIEAPVPYNRGPVLTKSYITQLDTCSCDRFASIKQEAANASYNSNLLSSLNQYLSQAYGDTLTTALFNAMQSGCSELRRRECPEDTSGSSSRMITPLASSYDSTCRDTVIVLPLAVPQPMPEFLKCGYTTAGRCLTCDTLSALTGRFKTYFGSGAPYTGDNLDSTQLSQNVLYAKYLNYYTGFRYRWTDYAKAAADNSCALADYTAHLNSTQTVLCRSVQPLDDTTGIFLPQSPCQKVVTMSIALATTIYRARTEKLLADFEAQYRQKCLEAGSIEEFSVSDTIKEYHYTLYYYDLAGNLVKTVPPKGARPNFSITYTNSIKNARKVTGEVIRPEHLFVTDYRYNSLNQVVAQKTPDANTSHFWYDKLGRLAVSQNAQQLIDNKYSYTVYDVLGRITEVGQKPQTTAMSQVVSQDPAALNNWITIGGSTREQLTLTVYDMAYEGLTNYQLTQLNLRNRVSYTYTKALETNTTHDAATYYTYDIHGNVDTLLQDYAAIMASDNANRFKRICYEYDLVSGKVNKVSYQPGNKDAFYHRYYYDAENRITCVSTSRDNILWEEDAGYSYYKHGPLARTVIGQQRVQGVDYNYTLQGWLKGINQVTAGGSSSCPEGSAMDTLVVNSRASNTPSQYTARLKIIFDTGFESGAGDAFETVLNESLPVCQIGGGGSLQEEIPVARDAYNIGLHYYTGDYKAISNNTAGANILSGLSAAAAAPLYNGNIAAMSVNIPKLGDAKVYNYHYDQLNRLVQMDAYNGLNTGTGAFTPVRIDDYKERISYDPNGNILAYVRNGTTAGGKQLAMDSLLYDYYPSTNQLKHIADDAGYSSNYTEDIDNQSNAANYTYDAIGNLKTDAGEGLTNIDWNVYGKIKSITKSTGSISYTYDASGNRISKTVGDKTTIYVRDASGNVMGVYERTGSADLAQVETHLYGSSRLGIQKELTVSPLDVALSSGFTGGKLSTFTRGEKFFELSNHLGNVLVTVSDKKIQVGSGTTIDYYAADIASANDYYPFGMLQPGRSYNAAGYRYGFNGKENDNEVKGEGNQQDYGMRIYDPRVGRFLSEDPITKQYPELTPYQFASNRPIDGIDLDGLEFLKKDNTNYSINYKPMLDAPNVSTGVINATHNTLAFVWNLTFAPVMTVGKGVNNYFAGDYKEPDHSVDPVYGFMESSNAIFRYHKETPIKQQIKDVGAAATDLSNYELPVWLAASYYFGAFGTASRVEAAEAASGGSRSLNPLNGTSNCAGCTIAGDATLKGFPATALNHGVTTLPRFLKWFGASSMEIHKTTNSIINVMSKMKDGATGVIFGNRGSGQIGHFFNVVKQDGVVQFLDFQKAEGARVLNPNTLMQEQGFKDLYFLNTTVPKP
jgi:RHS repeat-associated protein